MRGRGVCVAGVMATATGGMHPTGMHSCFEMYLSYRDTRIKPS